MSRLAACLSRRLCTSTSSTAPYWVYRAPQPVLLAVDRHDHLIEVPLVASRQRGGSDTPGNAQAELHRPASHGLVGQIDATGGQQFLNHAQAQRETVVQPHRVADHIGRKPVAGVGNGVGGWRALRQRGSFHARDCRRFSLNPPTT
jgi:hypothetical protein